VITVYEPESAQWESDFEDGCNDVLSLVAAASL
jgi:hypothetical protein